MVRLRHAKSIPRAYSHSPCPMRTAPQCAICRTRRHVPCPSPRSLFQSAAGLVPLLVLPLLLHIPCTAPQNRATANSSPAPTVFSHPHSSSLAPCLPRREEMRVGWIVLWTLL